MPPKACTGNTRESNNERATSADSSRSALKKAEHERPTGRQRQRVSLCSQDHHSTAKANEIEEPVLTTRSPLQHFIKARLLAVPTPHTVPCDASLGSVVEELHRRRQGACTVSFKDGRLEFFDCTDFNAYLLDALSGRTQNGAEGWLIVKQQLRILYEKTVESVIRFPRPQDLTFKRFEATSSFEQLLAQLRQCRRVPVYQDDELCGILTANDVLELCGGCLTQESTKILDSMHLDRLIANQPAAMSGLEVREDLSLLEVMQQLHNAGSRATPVLATDEGSALPPALAMWRLRPVGQFDLSALWAIYARGLDDDTPWWWEDKAMTSNVFLEPCMDFLTSSPFQLDRSSSNRERAPFAQVWTQEPLARAISRACTSKYRNVLVYDLAAGNPSDQDQDRPKKLKGDVSAQQLVMAMATHGLFDILQFDKSRPRPKKFRRAVSVTEETPFEVEPRANSKVKFTEFLELELLHVPICPVHDVLTMKYEGEAGPGKVANDSVIVDFEKLKDIAHEQTAVGSEASCLTCQLQLGRIRLLEGRLREPPPTKNFLTGWMSGKPKSVLKGTSKVAKSSSSKPRQPSSESAAAAALERQPAELHAKSGDEPSVAAADNVPTGPPSTTPLLNFFCCASACSPSASKERVPVDARRRPSSGK